MSEFTLHLESSSRYERIEKVASFVGEDESGQFGILAGHEKFVTVLLAGLARYRVAGGGWQYLALEGGGVVLFAGKELHLATARYARDADYHSMRAVVREQREAEDVQTRELRASVRNLEEEMYRRLYALERRSEF